ncbi:MAG TPA: GAF domain-containing protein, partial [Firmicutes bacterium]|nr:GAF domain-containing protein [Bacillota bacterium]
MAEGGVRQELRWKRQTTRRWRNAWLALACLATVLGPLAGVRHELVWSLGALTTVLAGAWHGWGGGLLLAVLLAGAALGLSTAGLPAFAGAGWLWLSATWAGLAIAAAWTRRGLERRIDERRLDYQELAEEHLRAHERFEALTARLREKNETLERKYAEAAALLSAVGAIGNSTKPAEIYETIVDTAAKLVGCDACVLAIMCDSEQPWPVVGTRGSFGAWRKGDRIRAGEGVLGWVAQHGQPVVVEDLAKDARFVVTAAESWFRSLVVVPLLIEGRVAAVLGL